MIINHNIAALNAWRQLQNNTTAANSALEKLSSGYRINKAGDDAAGLAISQKMQGQINGLSQASRNAQDAISLVQTAEGALNETQSILQRMRELAVQSANDTNTAQDRLQVQTEINQLTNEIDRIANTTQFNTKNLINGTLGSGVAAAQAAVLTGTVALNGGAATSATTLAALADTAGNVFGIAAGDEIIIQSKVGSTYVSGTYTVSAAADTLGSLLAEVSSVIGANEVTMVGGAIHVSGIVGAANDLGVITLTVKDSSGNIREAATNSLSAFTKNQNAADIAAEGTATFMIGANQGQTMTLNIGDMRATALGVNGLSLQTQSQANLSITVIDNAINTVSTQRANLGAVQNRLEHTINNLGTSSQNLTAAQANITDVDMASEMSTYTKDNVLQQAATAMLAQANQQPSLVLQLLK
jgi:flagellin